MQFSLYSEFVTMKQLIQKRITKCGNIKKKKKHLIPGAESGAGLLKAHLFYLLKEWLKYWHAHEHWLHLWQKIWMIWLCDFEF